MFEYLFVDCEFNGFNGKLISMAIVSSAGDEWYEVVAMGDELHPWVRQHVIPFLDKEPIDDEEFRTSLHRFLRKFPAPFVVADWYADLVHFFGSLRGDDYGSTMNFPCKAILDTRKMNIVPDRPHNALSDARALCAYWMKHNAPGSPS